MHEIEVLVHVRQVKRIQDIQEEQEIYEIVGYLPAKGLFFRECDSDGRYNRHEN